MVRSDVRGSLPETKGTALDGGGRCAIGLPLRLLLPLGGPSALTCTDGRVRFFAASEVVACAVRS